MATISNFGSEDLNLLVLKMLFLNSASDWSKISDVARRRQALYNVARLLQMVPIGPWRNSTPVFGAAAFCTTKIDDIRVSLTLTSLTPWRQIMEVIEVDHVKEGLTVNRRYSPYV